MDLHFSALFVAFLPSCISGLSDCSAKTLVVVPHCPSWLLSWESVTTYYWHIIGLAVGGGREGEGWEGGDRLDWPIISSIGRWNR